MQIIFFIPEKVCDVVFDISTVDLDKNSEFYLHLFGDVPSLNHGVIGKVEFKNNQNQLKFNHEYCPDYDGKGKVDLFGICDPTTSLSLKKGIWNIIHVMTQKSGQNLTVRSNEYCPYGEDVTCIIVEVDEKSSVLQVWHWVAASVNCISGKIH